MPEAFTTITATIPAWGQIAISALIGGIVAIAGATAVGRRVRGRAHRTAFSDHLTGIANRRAFERELASSFRLATANNLELGILVIDVDAFGDINQLYGRSTGDQVLAEVAERIRLRVRQGDFIARLDADEFGVICHETKEEEILALRRNLEAYVNFARTAPVVLSIGVGCRQESDHSFEQILRRARESVLDRRDERPIRAVDEALADLLSP
jgi:diguanylate cyclase (GGDEF)-like protein